MAARAGSGSAKGRCAPLHGRAGIWGRQCRLAASCRADRPAKIHTLSGKPAREVNESQRGGARGTRAGLEGRGGAGALGRPRSVPRATAGRAYQEPEAMTTLRAAAAAELPPPAWLPPFSSSPRPPAARSPTPERGPRRAVKRRAGSRGTWADLPAASRPCWLRPRAWDPRAEVPEGVRTAPGSWRPRLHPAGRTGAESAGGGRMRRRRPRSQGRGPRAAGHPGAQGEEDVGRQPVSLRSPISLHWQLKELPGNPAPGRFPGTSGVPVGAKAVSEF